MQWNVQAKAGFTTGVPWLPVPPSFTAYNVEVEKANPSSLLAWYRSIIRLKKTNPAFARGENVMLDTGNTKVLSWMRRATGAHAVVVCVNLTAQQQIVNLAVPNVGRHPRTLLKTPGAANPASLTQIVLGPFGVYVGEVRIEVLNRPRHSS